MVGTVLLIADYATYIPRFEAYKNALMAWAQNPIGSTPVPMIAFGLDSTSVIISGILCLVGVILIFVGVTFLVIALFVRIMEKTRVQVSIQV